MAIRIRPEIWTRISQRFGQWEVEWLLRLGSDINIRGDSVESLSLAPFLHTKDFAVPFVAMLTLEFLDSELHLVQSKP